MTKPLTLTKADLIQEVERITELKRSDSETIVETIFDSIIDAPGSEDVRRLRFAGHGITLDVDVHGQADLTIELRVSPSGPVAVERTLYGVNATGASSVMGAVLSTDHG